MKVFIALLGLLMVNMTSCREWIAKVGEHCAKALAGKGPSGFYAMVNGKLTCVNQGDPCTPQHGSLTRGIYELNDGTFECKALRESLY